MRALIILSLLAVLAVHPDAAATGPADTLLYHTDFSRLSPGVFGEYAALGFPEYHHVPLEFTDGWEIVNNRGPTEWKVFELDGEYLLEYLGYNTDVWTHDFTYPILCRGDLLWGDYSLEVKVTPLGRAETAGLTGIVFRYRDGRHYYLFAFGPDSTPHPALQGRGKRVPARRLARAGLGQGLPGPDETLPDAGRGLRQGYPLLP